MMTHFKWENEFRKFSAAPPPPVEPAAQESFLSGIVHGSTKAYWYLQTNLNVWFNCPLSKWHTLEAKSHPSVTLYSNRSLQGSSGSYVEDMYEAWAHDPSSVHASWDAYFRYMRLRLPTQPLTFVIKSINIWRVFRGGAYQAPPSLGNTTNPNEIALASLGGALPGMGGGAPSAEIIDAHLAVQGTIRSYQVENDAE